MKLSRNSIQDSLNQQIRPSLSALRRRGDWSPLSSLVRSRLNLLYPVGHNQDHLRAVMEWLCAAQDGTPDEGVSAFYDLRLGEWCPSYPETTGYIIPTFFNYAATSQEPIYRQRALLMANWLLTIQLESGAFPIGPLWPGWERTPIVFDTGQIIFGLVRAYQETHEPQYLHAAQRAGDWLSTVQDGDGGWSQYTSLGFVHTYNVRTAWALAFLYKTSNQEKYRQAALKNLDWALSQQESDGWYQNNGFNPGEDPLTHTIAYTIEGFLEAGVLLGESRYIDSARLAADALAEILVREGYLRARFGPSWRSLVDWSCLTGTAQMALVWFRLYQLTGDETYLKAGLSANHYLKQRQDRRSDTKGYKGGISGSYPIYADYEPFRQLNWAAKFFADSLMLELSILDQGGA